MLQSVMDRVLQACLNKSVARDVKKCLGFIDTLDNMYLSFDKYSAPDSIAKKLFESLWRYLDAILFNEVTARKDTHTCSVGFELKIVISQLENAFHKKSKFFEQMT
jgi:hypothetical protein